VECPNLAGVLTGWWSCGRRSDLRAAASAFCYHIGAIFGGVVPPVVTLLAGYHHMGLGIAMLAGTVLGAISFCLALLVGPETKGTRFDPGLVVD
jgi:MFS transporter, SHS family, lactate transporter